MQKFAFYQHKDNQSVFIEVTKVFWVREKRAWMVSCVWWKYHTNPKFRYCMCITSKFFVNKETLKNWRRI